MWLSTNDGIFCLSGQKVMLYSLSQHFSVADTSLIINKCLLTLSEFSPSVLTKILMAFSSLIGKKPQKTKQLLGKLTDIVLLDLIYCFVNSFKVISLLKLSEEIVLLSALRVKKKQSKEMSWIVYQSFFFFFSFTILYWFCHTSTWIHHRRTRVPHPEPCLPPSSPYGPSGSSQCTSPRHRFLTQDISSLQWIVIKFIFKCFYIIILLV